MFATPPAATGDPHRKYLPKPVKMRDDRLTTQEKNSFERALRKMARKGYLA